MIQQIKNDTKRLNYLLSRRVVCSPDQAQITLESNEVT